MTEPISPRASMILTVSDRLDWAIQNSEQVDVASLIVDDLLASSGYMATINRAVMNGMDAGFEKALRDSIAAVGEVPRCDYVLNEAGEPQLIMYQHAQRAIAGLSKRGLAELWDDKTPSPPAPPEASSPATSSTG